MAALLAANQSSRRQDGRQELGVEARDIPRAEARRVAAADGRVDERAGAGEEIGRPDVVQVAVVAA